MDGIDRRAFVSGVFAATAMGLGACANQRQSKPDSPAGEERSEPARQDGSVEFAPNNIPVVYLHIDEQAGPTIEQMNQSKDHSVGCVGAMDLVVPDGFAAGHGGGPQQSLSGLELEYIRGRGNSTWDRPKNPYKFKLSKKHDLFGMADAKSWVLLANYFDNTLVRNRLASWLGSELGMAFTPQCVPVDVVMNERYLGSYVLCEQVGIGKGRVDVPELTPTDVDEPLISGGYLLALCPERDEAEPSMFVTSREVWLYNREPSFDPQGGGSEDYACDQQRDYIRSYVQAAEDAMFGKGGAPYADYIGVRSFADYWLLQMTSRNMDAFVTSSNYLHKDRDGKLCWGPLWDFDLAWNRDSFEPVSTQGWSEGKLVWYEPLLGDAAFVSVLKERVVVLGDLLAQATAKDGVLDRYCQQINASWQYDHGLYGSYDDGGQGRQIDSLEEEINLLRAWIDERMQWVLSAVSSM